MITETYTVTSITLTELHDLLREPMAACGFKVENLYFQSERWELIQVASGFDLTVPCVGTLEGLIKEEPPTRSLEVPSYRLATYLACLTDETIFGDKAIPKTDYRLLDS